MRVTAETLAKLPVEKISSAREVDSAGCLDHLDAVAAQRADHPAAGDPVEEGPVRGRGEDHPVLDHEHVGVGELGDVAQHVVQQAVVEAARLGLDEGARRCSG